MISFSFNSFQIETNVPATPVETVELVSTALRCTGVVARQVSLVCSASEVGGSSRIDSQYD